jgi:hypothetical protein
VAGEPTINPYAPPTTDLAAPSPSAAEGAFPRPMFSPRQMLAAALFGSVAAGVVLLQANYRAMDRSATANKALLFGLLASAAFFVVAFLIPDRLTTPINIAAALTFYKLAETMQGAAFFRHRAASGRVRSNWVVFGTILATLVAAIILAAGVLLATGGLDDELLPTPD